MCIFVSLISVVLALSSGVSSDINPDRVAVVLSRGRSGSTELISLVNNIANGYLHSELFGGNAEKMAELKDPLDRMIKFLEKSQKAYPHHMVGFKWKPYYEDENYDKVWDWFAKTGAKVVFNHRNPLDKYISVTRAHSENGQFNCVVGDTKCLNTQKSLKVEIDTAAVISHLEEYNAETNATLKKLHDKKINHFVITYEQINHGTMEDRLAHVQKLADFLMAKKKVRKILDESVFAVKTEYIGHYHQNETVSNYDELVRVLQGSPFQNLLH